MHFVHFRIGHFRVILDVQILPFKIPLEKNVSIFQYFWESLSKNLGIIDEKYPAWQRPYILKQFRSSSEISFL